MSNFVALNSIHGTFILNKLDTYQYRPLVRTGILYNHDEILKILDIINILPADPVIIDGGANMGVITIPMAANTSGCVYSFEPQKMFYYCLCGGLALNQISNVNAYNCALGASMTRLSLPAIDYNTYSDFGGATLEDNGKNDVEVITIDSLQLPRLDFIKLDVETMEIQALLGGIDTITQYRPWCWVEYVRVNLHELKMFFNKLDYTVYYADDANIVAVPDDHILPWMTPIE